MQEPPVLEHGHDDERQRLSTRRRTCPCGCRQRSPDSAALNRVEPHGEHGAKFQWEGSLHAPASAEAAGGSAGATADAAVAGAAFFGSGAGTAGCGCNHQPVLVTKHFCIVLCWCDQTVDCDVRHVQASTTVPGPSMFQSTKRSIPRIQESGH